MEKNNKAKKLKNELEKCRSEIKKLKETISSRKKQEQKLLESEERYKNLLKVVPDTIYRISPEGNFTFISDSIVHLGYTPEELIGKHFSEIIHPNDIPAVSREMVLPKFTGKTLGIKRSPKLFDERRTGERITRCLQLRVIPKDWNEDNGNNIMYGSVFSCGEVVCTGHYEPDKSEGECFLGTVGVIRDVTDRVKTDEKLQNIQKLNSIGILAGGIAHDFNNFLTAIVGNISIAKMEIDEHSPALHALSDAENASLKAKNLTSQLLTFSRGGAPIKKAASVKRLLEDNIEFTLRGTNIKCRYTIPDNLWTVEVDEGQIGQVINNLIINSSQAMPGGGYIDVFAENITIENDINIKSGNYVHITIRDYGSGIPENEINKIFDPYYTTKEGGNGLGLTTSFSIIKSHDGEIGVESEEGNGTHFFFYLPATADEVIVDDSLKPVSYSCCGRILIMDDNIEILKSTGKLLRNVGFEVSIAKDGIEAIDFLRNEMKSGKRYDVVIMDLTIPGGLGGKETVQILKELDPNVKTIVSSGYINDEVISDHKKFGFDDVITKPYRLESLIEAINRLMK
jgi:PAS domain S-box-containing protein